MMDKAQSFIIKNKWYILAILLLILAIYFWSKRPKKKRKNKMVDYTKFKTITAAQREKLDTLHPDVKADFFEFIDKAQQLPNVKLEITSTYRSYQFQHDLKKRVGKIAANPGRSPHQYGLAVDMVIHYKGERLGLKGAKSKWLASGVVDIAKKLGMTWGGDFKTHPYDPVHFDVVKREGVSTSKLMEAGKKRFGSYMATRGNELDLSLGKI